jgi:hypothetical protein
VIFTSGYSAEIAGRDLELEKGQTFLQKPASPTPTKGSAASTRVRVRPTPVRTGAASTSGVETYRALRSAAFAVLQGSHRQPWPT